MKKHIFLAGACVLGMALAGCGSAPAAQDEGKEDEGKEVLVSIDAYGYSDGLLSVTETIDGNQETSEYGSIDLYGISGKTVNEALTDMDYSDLEIINDSDVFEGWMEFQMNITTDADGFDQYEYINLSGNVLYTTEELLELEIPEYDVAYVAKWESIAAEDYFVEEEPEEIVDTCFFNLSANGGEMTFSDEDNGSYSLDNYNYLMVPGDSLQDAMSGSAMSGAVLEEIQKEGAEFAGWTVYEADFINWVEEEAEDGAIYFPYESEYADAHFIQLENGSLYAEKISTDELKALVCEGKNFFAYAEWE